MQGSRRNPAQRFRWESSEKVCSAHEKSLKAFFIALRLFLSWSGLRGSNSLPGIPRTAYGDSREPCPTSD